MIPQLENLDVNKYFRLTDFFFSLVNRCQLCDEHAHCNVDRCVCDEGYRGDGKMCYSKLFFYTKKIYVVDLHANHLSNRIIVKSFKSFKSFFLFEPA